MPFQETAGYILSTLANPISVCIFHFLERVHNSVSCKKLIVMPRFLSIKMQMNFIRWRDTGSPTPWK